MEAPTPTPKLAQKLSQIAEAIRSWSHDDPIMLADYLDDFGARTLLADAAAQLTETATLTERLARAEEQLHEIWRVLGLQREPGVGAPYLLPADAGPVRCESIADAVQGSLARWQRVAMTMSSYASHACPDASQCTCGLLELQRTIDAALRAAAGGGE